MRSRLTGAADIATIIIALVVGGFALGMFRGKDGISEPPRYEVGDQLLGLTSDVLSSEKKSLVLFLQSTCRFCTESMPFYRALRDAAKDRVRFVVLAPQGDNRINEYLAEHKLSVDKVVRIDFATLKVSGTPTALLVGPNAQVLAAWLGMQNETGQQEIKSRVLVPSS